MGPWALKGPSARGRFLSSPRYRIGESAAGNEKEAEREWRPSKEKLVTQRFEYDGGRQVTVYVPPKPPEAVVFAGDGQVVSSWGGVLEVADVPATMFVGVHRLADETLRLHEYSPGFDPERFAAHERFFVDDVGQWTRSHFGVALAKDRTAVFGVSASGELALAMGLRHPDIYGAISAPLLEAVTGRLARWRTRSRGVPRRRNAGAVLPRERDPVGGRPRQCRCGRCDDRACGIARRRVRREELPLMVVWAFGP